MLLKVVFNTNKTGHHVIRYSWLIVESGLRSKKYLATMLYVIPDTQKPWA